MLTLEPCGRWHGRLTAYIIREHQRGRPLGEILADRFVVEHASDAAITHLLEDPRLIQRLAGDCLRALSASPDIEKGASGGSDGDTSREVGSRDGSAAATTAPP